MRTHQPPGIRSQRARSFRLSRDAAALLGMGVLLLLVLPSLCSAQGSEKIQKSTLQAVVKVATSPRKFGPAALGTGFLVGESETPTKEKPVFLVINKHMVGDWNCADGDIADYYDWLDVYFYRQPATGLPYALTRIKLKDDSGALRYPKVRLYPDPAIDLAMVALDTELEPNQNITYAYFAPSRLLDFDKIASAGLAGLGETVFALGYPFGITSLRTDLPIAKAGYLSSMPGEELTVQLGCLARNQTQTAKMLSGKVILVDGLIVPGNSGGPVVLEYGLRTRLNPQTHQFEFTTAPIDNYVIGFISSGVGPSGLTTVIATDYIKEMMTSYTPPAP